jgi:hypothetical protein
VDNYKLSLADEAGEGGMGSSLPDKYSSIEDGMATGYLLVRIIP